MLTPDEFSAVCARWSVMHDNEERGRWERMRLLAAFFVQPYSKKKVAPRELIPLPWDKENAPQSNKQAIQELAKMVGKR